MEFQLDAAGNYWQQLPAALGGAELVVDLQETRGTAPDWAVIEAFGEFLLSEGMGAVARAQLPLRYLAEQTGWFESIADATFSWHAVVLLYAISQVASPASPRWAFELHFTLEPAGEPWADVYGNWVATFQGRTIVGLRREQT